MAEGWQLKISERVTLNSCGEEKALGAK